MEIPQTLKDLLKYDYSQVAYKFFRTFRTTGTGLDDPGKIFVEKIRKDQIPPFAPVRLVVPRS